MAVIEAPTLQLATFGVLSLNRAGSPVRGSGQQSKPLALLAFLAAAGPKGATRDKILGHLWPDLDSSHARHALKQTVYALRRDSDEPGLIVGSTVLRLDPAAVRADVLEFRDALAAGALEKAAAIYTGTFLDGFYLEEGGTFEEWVERERAALARAYREAVRALAQRTGHPGSSINWWRRLVDADPLDSSAVHGLMQAMVANGSSAEAIRLAREHAHTIWRELEATPDPSIMLLTEQIRGLNPMDVAELERSTPVERLEVPARPPLAGRASAPGKQRRRRPGVAAWLSMASVLMVALVWAGLESKGKQAEAGETAALIIPPLSYRGQESYAHLRSGVTQILRRNLATVAGLRVIDPRAVSTADSSTPAKAALLLDGEIVQTDERLRIDARVSRQAGKQSPLATARVEGPVSSLFDLTDRLSADLAAQLRPGSNAKLMRSAAATTSLEAFAAYAEGEEHFLAGRYRDAVASFQTAVAEDSTFALAYYRLSIAADWASLTDLAPEAAERAGRYQSRLPEQDRLLLRGYLSWRRGSADEAERAYRELLAAHPDNMEAWFQLGEVLFHGNPFRGRSVVEARQPFERALAFAPGNVRAISHLVRVAAIERRWSELDSLQRGLPSRGEPGSEPWVEVFRDRVSGAREVPAKTLQYLRDLDDVLIYTAAERAAVYLGELGMAEEVAALLTEPNRSAATRAYGHLTLAELALVQGRWREARRELNAGQALEPARGLTHRALLTTTLFLPADSVELMRLRQLFAGPAARPRSPVSIYFSWQELPPALLGHYLEGLIASRLNRDSIAAARAALLERSGNNPEDRALARGLAHTLRAVVAWSGGRPQDGLAQLDSRTETRLETVRTPFGSESFERFLRAEFLRQLGDPPAALGWYQSMGENTVFDLIYLGPALLQGGMIYERLGDRKQAAASYRRLLELWERCDPELRAMRDEAERRLRLIER